MKTAAIAAVAVALLGCLGCEARAVTDAEIAFGLSSEASRVTDATCAHLAACVPGSKIVADGGAPACEARTRRDDRDVCDDDEGRAARCADAIAAMPCGATTWPADCGGCRP